MKRRLVFLVLVALSIGCNKEHRPQVRSVKGLSTEPTTWHGFPGTAVTIQFNKGTNQFWVGTDRPVQSVGFYFAPPVPPSDKRFIFVQVGDFEVPVMKVAPHAVTLFFRNDETSLGVLEHLPDQIEAGTLKVFPCDPSPCGSEVSYVEKVF
jgi:hypothetical protein